jgi:hypothetical protein
MKLKSSLTFVTISVMVFGMIFATSATQIDKIFADKPIVGADNNFDVNGDKLSNSEKMRFFENTLGAIFGGGSNPNSGLFGSQPNPTSSDTPTSSADPKDQPCIQSEGTGTKDYYCFGTHHHCEKGKSPGCVLEGGRV